MNWALGIDSIAATTRLSVTIPLNLSNHDVSASKHFDLLLPNFTWLLRDSEALRMVIREAHKVLPF